MASKPASTPRWAQTTGGVTSNIVAPNSGKQDVGTVPAEKPPAQYLNWLFNLIYLWVLYLADAVFVATSGSGLPGLTATGDTNQPGVSGTGNGTAAGLVGNGGTNGPGVIATAGAGASSRGAINLAPQATANAPQNGDVWLTSQAVFAWISGAVVQLADAAKSFGLCLNYVLNPGNTASTGYFGWAGTATAAVPTNPGAGAVGQTRLLMAQTGQIKAVSIVTGQLTAGGTVTITLLRNGVASSLTATVASGTAAGTVVNLAGAPQSVTAGQYIEILIQNNAGVTASIGLSMCSVLMAAV